jgi:hypothetical protein
MFNATADSQMGDLESSLLPQSISTSPFSASTVLFRPNYTAAWGTLLPGAPLLPRLIIGVEKKNARLWICPDRKPFD